MSAVVIAETVRRHVTNVGFLAAVAFMGIVSLGVSVFNRPAAAWPSLVTLLAIVAGAGAIGPEFSSGTLQLILVKPLTRAAYLLSRVTGIVFAVWLAALACALLELTGRALWGSGPLPLAAVGSTLLHSMADSILVVALLALLGSLTRAYFNAAIYISVMTGLSVAAVVLNLVRQSANPVGRFLARHTGIDSVLQAIDRNVFPELPPALEGRWILMVLGNAAVALLLACLAFRRREVPYGAD